MDPTLSNSFYLAVLAGFLTFIGLEALSFRRMARRDPQRAKRYRGYSLPDAATSLTLGAGNVVVRAGEGVVQIALIAALAAVSPFVLSMDSWWMWILVVLGIDFCFYWDHRFHHRVRIGWAGHVPHHSSEYFNLTTALRQSWTRVTRVPFYVPLGLFFPSWAVLIAGSVELAAAFWTHTERIGRLPRWAEYILVTPSSHRVHHGSDDEYLDKNYGGILLIWDRLFGTFVEETFTPTYGLTTNIHTYNPIKVNLHEWGDIIRDIRHARTWGECLGYAFGPPGWTPAGGDSRAAAASQTATAPASAPAPGP
jgi:sterol desaturase/sphingolipid hydroxylase (fatty acid hydroxylase superfamily)